MTSGIAILLAVLTAVLVALGAAVGGKAGLIIAFLFALVMNVVSLWKSDTIVLRMFKAQEVSEAAAPDALLESSITTLLALTSSQTRSKKTSGIFRLRRSWK